MGERSSILVFLSKETHNRKSDMSSRNVPPVGNRVSILFSLFSP